MARSPGTTGALQGIGEAYSNLNSAVQSEAASSWRQSLPVIAAERDGFERRFREQGAPNVANGSVDWGGGIGREGIGGECVVVAEAGQQRLGGTKCAREKLSSL